MNGSWGDSLKRPRCWRWPSARRRWDSLLARPRHDALTLLTAVAARTRRVELGTAVLLPALRNPVLLAHQVATLDRIAEGRLILGVGIASDWPNIRAEFEAAGVPFDKRVGRMIEGLALCLVTAHAVAGATDRLRTLSRLAVGAAVGVAVLNVARLVTQVYG